MEQIGNIAVSIVFVVFMFYEIRASIRWAKEDKIMDRQEMRDFEWTKVDAQMSADIENEPVHVIKSDGAFHTALGEAVTPEDEILYTAHPHVNEMLTPNTCAYYDEHRVWFTKIRKVIEDNGEEAEMETTTDTWSVEYAKKVQAFLNKVL